MRDFPKITITEKGEKMLREGHVWVYADEVVSADKPYTNGDIVDVLSGKGKYLGSGFINDNSKIRVRVFSKNTNDKFDDAFWARRVAYAVDYRRTVMPGDDFLCCRLIFGESDSFPGLTIDRFGNVLVSEVACLGIDMRKDVIYSAVLKYLASFGEKIDFIYERNDSALRALEGLPQYCSYYINDDLGLTENKSSTAVIRENGILYNVDFVGGQKTGFFLDQKYNRAAVARIARGKNVLDCFTHTGAFALNVAAAGASHVTAVDISADALKTAEANAKLNRLEDKIDFVCADVFDFLTKLSESKSRAYDYIILDPPAFTKSRDTVKNAIRGYKEINLKAMKLLNRGGYLATCSCSHFMTNTHFCQMIHNAAEDASVSLKQIEARRQSPDHPILWNVPETDYLKFYIFQVI